MPRYVKNEKGYEKSFEADWKAVKKGLKKARSAKGSVKKVPTSIALDPIGLCHARKRRHSNFCNKILHGSAM